MSDLWEDEGLGGGGAASGDDDDWDEGEDGTAPGLEDGFDDPDGLDDEDWDEGEDEPGGS